MESTPPGHEAAVWGEWILVLTVEEVSMDNDPLQDKVTAFTKMPIGVIHLHSIIHHAASHVLIKRSRVCHKKKNRMKNRSDCSPPSPQSKLNEACKGME